MGESVGGSVVRAEEVGEGHACVAEGGDDEGNVEELVGTRTLLGILGREREGSEGEGEKEERERREIDR